MSNRRVFAAAAPSCGSGPTSGLHGLGLPVSPYAMEFRARPSGLEAEPGPVGFRSIL